jgi:sugar phosphate isomerase/epimerase
LLAVSSFVLWKFLPHSDFDIRHALLILISTFLPRSDFDIRPSQTPFSSSTPSRPPLELHPTGRHNRKRTIVSIVKIGIQTKCVGVPLKQALDAAARLGADGVAIDAQTELRPAELSDTAVRHVRKLLGDRRLGVSAIGFSTRLGYATLERMEERLAATRAAMKMASQLGADVVTAPIGPIPEDTDSPVWQVLVQAMLSLGRYGEHVGARFAAQTATADGPALRRLLDALPKGAIGADLHSANLIRHGGSPAETVGVLGPDILHVHACDAVRNLATGTADEVVLGRGSVDFPALFAELERYGYRGWATIVRHGDRVQEDLADAVQFLRSLA